MQKYTIFNKKNKVFISKNDVDTEKNFKGEIIYCNSQNLNSYDFSLFFENGNDKDVFIVADGVDTQAVFDKVKSLFYFVRAAGGVVRNEKGEFLFMYRNGFWDLPKGHQEEGEDIGQTAFREVAEECGIGNLVKKEFIDCTYHTYVMNNRREMKQTYWYDMQCPSSEVLIPQKEEGIEELRWVKPQDIAKILKLSYPSICCLFETVLHK